MARSGGVKSGDYRTLLLAPMGGRCVFLHGFPKSDKANITQDEKKALHCIGKVTKREFDAICPPPVLEFSATCTNGVDHAQVGASQHSVRWTGAQAVQRHC